MKTRIITLAFILLSSVMVLSQTSGADKNHKYRSTSEGLNKDAVLIINEDNTFTNYGIYANNEEKDWYVWYTSGKCLITPDKILFKSYDTIPDTGKLIQSIKQAYISLKEYPLIKTEYEFVQLNYKDHEMFRGDSLITDGSKKITYTKTLKP